MANRAEHDKAGEVSLNVPVTVLDSIDTIFDALGLPEPGSVVNRLTPRYVAAALGIPTPDELADGFMQDMDRSLGIDNPPER